MHDRRYSPKMFIWTIIFLYVGNSGYCRGTPNLVFEFKMVIKIIFYNVKGLNSLFKRSMLRREVIKLQTDIICLQEMHLLEQNTHRLKHKNFPFTFHSSVDRKRAVVSILVKDTVAFQLPLYSQKIDISSSVAYSILENILCFLYMYLIPSIILYKIKTLGLKMLG